MKKLIHSFILASGLVVAVPQVVAEDSPHSFSANMSLTNDYKFYGISQSSRGWAVQGGLDYSHESGFYLGTWASTIDFNVGASDPAQIELDVYGGYANELSNGISYDAGVWYYGYPSQNEDEGGGDYNYYEIYGNLGYTFPDTSFDPTIGVGIYYSPDFFGEDGDSIHIPVSLDVSLPGGFGLYGNYGFVDVEGDQSTTGGDWGYYKFGITTTLAGFDFDLGYADADSGCEDFASEANCEGLVFSVGRSF